MNNIKIETVLRPAGPLASGTGCTHCPCRLLNMVRFDSGQNGLACRWNSHTVTVFN